MEQDSRQDNGMKVELTRPQVSSSRLVWRYCCLFPLLIVGGIGMSIAVLGFTGVLSGRYLRGNGYPDWSPDGKHIVFVSPRDGNLDIYIMESDGSNVQQLTKDTFAMFYSIIKSPYDSMPVWSPDGSRIAFVSGRDSTQMGNLLGNINYKFYVMNRDGSNVVELPFPHVVLDEPRFTWSPDGMWVTYEAESRVSRGFNWDIFIARLDGSDPIRLTTNLTDERRPVWSPDGNSIAYHSDPKGDWDIYIMGSDGSNPIRLTYDTGEDVEMDWSPDSRRIVFSSNRDGDYDLYIMNADGSHVVQLTNDPADDSQPSWSPDGEWIAFVSTRNGKYGDIYIIKVDGSEVVQLTHY
jgi:Tol biopolymer transport system component